MSIGFVNPGLLLYGMFLIPLLAIFLWYRERRRRARLNRIGDPDLIALLVARVSHVRRRWKAVLWLLALLFLLIAAARPTWGVRTDLIETQGVSVYVLLDVSQSMDAEDIAPSRIERAKVDIRDLTDELAGNEVGLIAFAGSAFVVLPLTTDNGSVPTFLNFISSDLVSRQGTVFGNAMRLALDSFQEAQAAEQVIVLFSDGENHDDTLNEALASVSSAGIPVHVVAYGTEQGSSIPIRNSTGAVVGNKQDRAGDVIITRLDETLLRDIAERTGGTYQRVDRETNASSTIASIINASEGSVLGDEDTVRGVERFSIFIFLALVFLSIEILTPEGTTR
ncbi:MAG: VWA domain-containing protein [Chloroflexota bacterium]